MRNLIAVLLSLTGVVGAALVFRQPQPQTVTSAGQQVAATPESKGIAPTPVPTLSALSPNPAPYPNQGAAPELQDNVWLNTASKTPLRLADLRGQVVLLEFWTFECINCLHVLPHIIQWYDSYHQQGLAVIGVHFPEFEYEANYDNLVAAVKRLNIPYPVAQDNDGATWNAWGQRYWPTLYLIDKRGNIRYEQIGEGGYDATETAIQALLAES